MDLLNSRLLLATGLGAVIGVAYARLARCGTGTCPLTSNGWTAGLFGAAIGLLMALNWTGVQARSGDSESVPAKSAATAPAAGPQGERAMAKHIESVADFDTAVLQSARPVLVDFYATWCGPCRMVAPIMDQLSTELAGRANVVKVDVDKVQDLAARYQIMGVPTVMLFDQGRPVKTFVGVRSKNEYTSAVEQAVAK